MSDTDSDSVALSNNVYTFQNRNTTVCAKGPDISNMTSLSLRNKMMTSMQISRNFDQYRYTESAYDHRNMYSHRETSPVSMRSEMLPRNFNRPFYHRAMSSQRSLLNGRSGSPMSMSVASCASVSAADIAMAFKNGEFSKSDLKVITEAYKKYMKRRIRKKFEKRRHLRLFLKGTRKGSGGESGEQGSDSSLSNDECSSMRNCFYKENLSSCRSTKTDVTHIKKTIEEGNIYKDCSANFKQKTFRNMFTVDPITLAANRNKSMQAPLLQKDRFKNGFLLPSQRFNNSLASATIPECSGKKSQNNVNYPKSIVRSHMNPVNNISQTTDSEHEEIFSRTVKETVVQKQTNRKRNLMTETVQTPNKKRCKNSPVKKIDGEIFTKVSETNSKTDDFNFAKPIFPVRKSANTLKEKVIAKSAPTSEINSLPVNELCDAGSPERTQERVQDKLNDTAQTCFSDISSKPSFIKRKLFTQKFDVPDSNKNNSDNSINSPQNDYDTIQKEKNKIRKLVTSQSCLNTDMLGDDNNFLDLIHKIVPADKMNLTSQTNRTKLQNKRSINEPQDKWDVTSVISACNNESVSDTFTDEEIFLEGPNKNKTIKIDKSTNTLAAKNKNNESNKTKNTQNNKENRANTKKKCIDKCNLKTCKVVLENVRPPAKELLQKPTGNYLNKTEINKNGFPDTINSNIKSCVKSFWDTDIESDVESFMVPKKTTYYASIDKLATPNRTNNITNVHGNDKENSTPTPEVNMTIQNNTKMNMQKLNIKNFRIRSHREPTSKKNLDSKETNSSSRKKEPTKQQKQKPQTDLKASILIAENNLNTTNKSNIKVKRGCPTPPKNTAKRVKTSSGENDISSKRVTRKAITPKNAVKTTKINRNKRVTPQKTSKSPKAEKLKKEVILSRKNINLKNEAIEMKNSKSKKNSIQEPVKVSNTQILKKDSMSKVDVSFQVKNKLRNNKVNIEIVPVKHDRSLRSRSNLSNSSPIIKNNNRTRRQINNNNNRHKI
ncbi:myb-like protein D [Bombyx mori]|uniref:Uncharacterized protein n=1 Tax=Bombyx mori TaxID=7091 RepID=A0A8R2DM41_BOMMO|nr:myb-like protein D [Bombyx mori]